MQTLQYTNLFGLGQVDNPLDHSLVPLRSRARYLRLVSTKGQAMDYAAGGFHVSVARGLAGGAADPAKDFAAGGTKIVTPAAPLNRSDIRSAWSDAANAYLHAFQAARTGTPVSQVKTMLQTANGLADRAYGLENVEPPRDPATGTTEPNSPRRFSTTTLALGLAGLMGLGVYAVRKGQKRYEEGMWV